MKSVDALTKADFDPLMGEILTVGGIELTVKSVVEAEAIEGFKRQPFSVFLTAAEVQGAPVFQGPSKVAHDALGELDLTVTRVMSRPGEAAYQIVFN